MIQPQLIKRRLNSQGVAAPRFESPHEVVRWLGAVQAQDLEAALYAVGLRMKSATADIVERAITERKIVRTWPMRGTLHFVPPEDAAWMTLLLGRRVNKKYAGQYRRAGLDGQSFSRARRVLVKALQGGKPVMRRDLVRKLHEAGLASAGGPGSLFLLGYWAQEGLTCQGPREGRQQTFVLLDEWVPRSRRLEDDEALAVLAQRYFSSHGPATAKDFAWWAGLKAVEAHRALDICSRRLGSERIGDETYWSGGQGDDAPGRAPRGSLHLVQAFDELTVAYKDRSAFLDSSLPKQDALSGIGPSVFLGGRFVGVWKRTAKNGTDAVLSFRLFEKLAGRWSRELERAAYHYGKFFDRKVTLDVRLAAR